MKLTSSASERKLLKERRELLRSMVREGSSRQEILSWGFRNARNPHFERYSPQEVDEEIDRQRRSKECGEIHSQVIDAL